MANSPSMRLVFHRSAPPLRRTFSALGIIAAFFFTIALSDSPRLHERLHKSLGEHQCAVTLFAAGACEHVAGSSPVVGPVSCHWAAVLFPSSLRPIVTRLKFSRLEHAPPSLA
ncbi:MAG: hypothetical protein H0W66_05570 [Chthoniobacterales bacterium]|nr:hypothetical protein [Chthoniobacterales bacterium]